MTRFTSLAAALLTSTALVSAAQADVTPQQAWESLQAQMTMGGTGQQLSTDGTETDGDTLIVRNVRVTTDQSQTQEIFGEKITTNSKSDVIMGDLTFVANGDGSVTVTYPDAMTMSLGGDTTGNDPWSATVDIALTNSTDVISEAEGGALQHRQSADAIAMTLTSVTGGDVALAGPNELTMTDTVSIWTILDGDLIEMEGDFSAASTTFNIALALPDDAAIKFDGSLDGLKGEGRFVIPADFDSNSPAYPTGMVMDFTYGVASGAYDFDIRTEDGPVAGKVSFGQSDQKFAMSEERVTIDGLAKDLAFEASVPMLPFPLSGEIAEYGIGFDMPLSKTDAPTDAGMKVILDGVALGDGIWGLFDPQAILPHTPLTVRADLGAMVKMFGSITDPEEMATADAPGELHSAKINELRINGVGLDVTGKGAVTFDNSDLETYDGMPAPKGTVTFDISGANGLIDNLVKMGLVQQEQAMMGRMTLGMFTKPTGDDALSSEIEFKDGGQIFANGQRLK